MIQKVGGVLLAGEGSRLGPAGRGRAKAEGPLQWQEAQSDTV